MPSQAIGRRRPSRTRVVEPPYEPTGETGFVTFGVPAPAPPTDALIAAAARPPEPGSRSRKAFETYIAPQPSRPPTGEPKPPR